MRRILILFSGGADSSLMLLWAQKIRNTKVSALLFNYGQKQDEELTYAREILKALKIGAVRLIELDISSAFQHTCSNQLEHSRDSLTSYPGVNKAHTPSRNAIFLSIAMSIAESLDFDEIWIGCNHSDRINLFPDCTQEWIMAMGEVAKINGHRPLTIKAPLLGLTKEDVLRTLEREGVNLKKIFSGYEPPKADNTAVDAS